jgi:hypothetical protein
MGKLIDHQSHLGEGIISLTIVVRFAAVAQYGWFLIT